MADNIINNPGVVETLGITDWEELAGRDEKISKGLAEVTLSSYADGATAPTIQAGSLYEVNGSYFNTTSNQSISGIAGISNSTQFYVKAVVTGSGNSSVATWTATTTAPTWSDAKQGWYGTSGSANDRYFFRIYKDSGGDYDIRRKYDSRGYLYLPDDINIGNDLTVGNDLKVDGIADADVLLQSQSGSLQGTGITESQVFNLFDNIIPDNGNKCLVSGVITHGNSSGTGIEVIVLTHANRFSSTRIQFFGTKCGIDHTLNTDINSTQTANADSGDGSAFDVTSIFASFSTAVSICAGHKIPD